MSARYLGPILLGALILVGGWAVAQQSPAERQVARQGTGHYTAIAAGQTAVLVETSTGRTWVMNQGMDGDSAWLPAQKLDSEDAARQWLVKERQQSDAVGEVQREMSRRLDSIRMMRGQKAALPSGK